MSQEFKVGQYAWTTKAVKTTDFIIKRGARVLIRWRLGILPLRFEVEIRRRGHVDVRVLYEDELTTKCPKRARREHAK